MTRDREKRIPKPNLKYSFNIWNEDLAYAFMSNLEVDPEEPRSYEEAINSKQAEKWIQAMKEEMKSLHKNQTWKLVPKPKGKSVIACK